VAPRPNGTLAVSATVRILGWAFLAQVLGGIVNVLLQSGHLPDQEVNAPELVSAMFDSVHAGVIEELVVLGFVVVTLRQAGRPLWEITLVALVLRGSYHIYYGPGVFGILLWAALFFWLYLRTLSLLPLMVAHVAWDAVAFLSQRWPLVSGVAFLGLIALWLACPILWLIERNNRPHLAGGPLDTGWGGEAGNGPAASSGPPAWSGLSSATPGPAATRSGYWVQQAPVPPPASVAGPAAPPPAQTWLAPPGWHPDPGGDNRWRWWDGTRWTEHVSEPDSPVEGAAGSPAGG